MRARKIIVNTVFATVYLVAFATIIVGGMKLIGAL